MQQSKHTRLDHGLKYLNVRVLSLFFSNAYWETSEWLLTCTRAITVFQKINLPVFEKLEIVSFCQKEVKKIVKLY